MEFRSDRCCYYVFVVWHWSWFVAWYRHTHTHVRTTKYQCISLLLSAVYVVIVRNDSQNSYTNNVRFKQFRWLWNISVIFFCFNFCFILLWFLAIKSICCHFWWKLSIILHKWTRMLLLWTNRRLRHYQGCVVR